MTHTISRRKVAVAGAWAVPAVAVASAAPALAASQLTDLAIEVSDPPVDFTTFDYDLSVPIYKSNRTTVGVMASLPQFITITNVGTVPATNPTGTLEVAMRDYGSDYAPVGSNQVKIDSMNPLVKLTEVYTSPFSQGPGSKWTYTYQGILLPGQSFQIPLRYWVNSPFRNVTFNVLVIGIVIDQTDGDYDDNSERLGYVPGFGV